MVKLFLLLFTFCLFTFSFCHAQPIYFKLRPMEGYNLDPKIKLEKGLNFFVISDRRNFIKHFGWINKPDTPRFDYEHVLVMAMPPTNTQAFLNFEKDAAKAGNYIEVYCGVKKDKHEIPYTEYPIVVAAIPKYFHVNQVRFYENDRKKKMLGRVVYRR